MKELIEQWHVKELAEKSLSSHMTQHTIIIEVTELKKEVHCIDQYTIHMDTDKNFSDLRVSQM